MVNAESILYNAFDAVIAKKRATKASDGVFITNAVNEPVEGYATLPPNWTKAGLIPMAKWF